MICEQAPCVCFGAPKKVKPDVARTRSDPKNPCAGVPNTPKPGPSGQNGHPPAHPPAKVSQPIVSPFVRKFDETNPAREQEARAIDLVRTVFPGAVEVPT